MDTQQGKVTKGGMVRSLAVLVAMGLNKEGKREIIRVSGRVSKVAICWAEFIESFCERGSKGVELIISDDHSG